MTGEQVSVIVVGLVSASVLVRVWLSGLKKTPARPRLDPAYTGWSCSRCGERLEGAEQNHFVRGAWACTRPAIGPRYASFSQPAAKGFKHPGGDAA